MAGYTPKKDDTEQVNSFSVLWPDIVRNRFAPIADNSKYIP